MATGVYSLYLANNTTPVAIAQPNEATWESKVLGQFADGTQRVSLYARVVWKFRRLTPTQYQVFSTNRLTTRQTIETWRRATGGVAGQIIMATGIMEETIAGTLSDGMYYGTTVTFIMVLPA